MVMGVFSQIALEEGKKIAGAMMKKGVAGFPEQIGKLLESGKFSDEINVALKNVGEMIKRGEEPFPEQIGKLLKSGNFPDEINVALETVGEMMKKGEKSFPEQISKRAKSGNFPDEIRVAVKTDGLSDKIGNEIFRPVKEVRELLKNKSDGMAREQEVAKELEEQYPPGEGNQIIPEVYLRDKDGNIVKDPETGEARRIDFVVVKDGKVVDSVEVTSKTANKTAQSEKEGRIRDAGGNYIKDNGGNIIEIPSTVRTRIERRA